jgi:myo-inositol-1(or 4)-monophosphatase
MLTSAEITQLVTAVNTAGAYLMGQWPGGSGKDAELRVREKSDGTPVTEADLESNRILIEALTRLFPSDAVLSEELVPDSKTLERSKRMWIIDPLDGTKSFVAGRDDFSILVAAVEDDLPTFGIMLFPARQQCIVVKQGHAAQCNGVPLRVSTTPNLAPGKIYIRNFECRRPELASPMMDSGLALLKVACGELDGAIIKMTTHRQWDVAAPTAVLLGAGGQVSDETGSKISLKPGPLGYKYYVASNSLIHEQLQRII